MASKMAKMAGLEHPVLCVDPSMEMLEVGKELPYVMPLHMSAEEWAGIEGENVSSNSLSYFRSDLILFFSVLIEFISEGLFTISTENI